MTAFLVVVGELFTFTIDKITDVAGLFLTTPILQLGLGLMVIGFVVGLLKRMIYIS